MFLIIKVLKKKDSYTPFYHISQMLEILQVEGQISPQQEDYTLLYGDARFSTVVWNPTHSTSEGTGLYFIEIKVEIFSPYQIFLLRSKYHGKE